MTVFLVSGLWHGASWTFVVWGGLHGLYRLLELWTEGGRVKIARMLRLEHHPVRTVARTLITLNLVCFAWIFFRAGSLSDASLLIAQMVQVGASTDLHAPWTVSLGTPAMETALALGLIGLLTVDHLLREFPQRAVTRIGATTWVHWIVYLLLTLAVLNLGLPRETPFVYLQF
jgi:hypothetical protein